ncbi:MAG: hypothetical protein AB7I27_17830 [Bacteriovoracaceae bacterium]
MKILIIIVGTILTMTANATNHCRGRPVTGIGKTFTTYMPDLDIKRSERSSRKDALLQCSQGVLIQMSPFRTIRSIHLVYTDAIFCCEESEHSCPEVNPYCEYNFLSKEE